ncbi:hypothetical protein AV656_03120 [Bhargavaea cecembensis]|uniref:Uncharacterized protein n=1 Tax=Bhargavaea cecembensis TaxID=394098 RepID=A0A165HK43_9BACL|nr:hypothetical protein [Bhargavaea cecembensis]KZE40268.1 hypothetical protein AV656_03120 [Bhargavaea cecembensis]
MSEPTHKVTDILKILEEATDEYKYLDPHRLNLLMQDLGIQTLVYGKSYNLDGKWWQPTGDYAEYGVMTVRKSYCFYKWKGEMIDILLSKRAEADAILESD